MQYLAEIARIREIRQLVQHADLALQVSVNGLDTSCRTSWLMANTKNITVRRVCHKHCRHAPPASSIVGWGKYYRA